MKFYLAFVTFIFIEVVTIGGIDADSFREKRQAFRGITQWTDDTMNYYFSNLPLEMQAMFRDAFDYLQSHTCLKFNYNENADNTVQITATEHNCYSYFGMQYGIQPLYLGYTCAAFGTAVHELMHALGFVHSQSRSDRDKYLIVDSDNSQDDVYNTYNILPFDYGSVMLYERDDHRIPRDPEYNYTMGSLRVAFYDMLFLNGFYNCNCDEHPKLECQNGGYQNPANCDECLCTDGFTGTLCNEFDGKVLNATTDWQKDGYIVFNRKGIYRSTMPLNYNFIITAPEGSIIEVRIITLDDFYCHRTCDWNGVELKYKIDRRIVSPLVCCNHDNLWNTTRSSTNNPFVIVKYGDDRGPYLQFEYRYIPGTTEKIERQVDNTLTENQ